jgi:hypothetical protein
MIAYAMKSAGPGAMLIAPIVPVRSNERWRIRGYAGYLGMRRIGLITCPDSESASA